MQFLSHSTQETEAIGEELAQKLRGGDVLAFTGSLGMGKTASRAVLRCGLGCPRTRHEPDVHHRQRVRGQNAALPF